jgi:hypothetical protein
MSDLARADRPPVERSARLTELELSIDESRRAGLKACLEIGAALREISDSRLYLHDYTTFDAYCQSRWGFTERRAHQYMQAIEIGTRVPIESEKQARELARLEPSAQVQAWNAAVERATSAGRTAPTSADVRFAVEARRGTKEEDPCRPTASVAKKRVPEPTVEADRATGEERTPTSRAATYAACCSHHSAAIRSLLPDLEAAVLSADPETAKGWHAASAELAELATQATELIHAAAQAGIEPATPAEEAEAARLTAKFSEQTQ